MNSSRWSRLPLVLALLTLTLPLLGAPPGRDGHELPLRPGPRLSPEGPAPTAGSGPEEPDRTRFLSEPEAIAARSHARRGVAASHVVVKFRNEVPETRRDSISRAAGARARRAARWADFDRVAPGRGQSIDELLAALRADPGVEWAEADPIYTGAIGSAAPAPPIVGASHVGDPLFPLQWNLERIHYHEALAFNPTGGAGVVVAVIDSGVAAGNGAAFPERRGVDLEGVTFLPGLDLVNGGPAFDEGIGVDPGPVERSRRFGHGTFAAAQIAAGVNNGVGIAGIAPRVTILPIRILGVDNFTTASEVAEAIHFAVAAGADVINMSLGGRGGFEPLAQAVTAADRAGVVLVAAAGNEHDDPDPPDDVNFPARYPEVIAVGATAFDGLPADYSNPGFSLDLVAPAGENPSAMIGNTRDASLAPSFVHDPVTGITTYGSFFITGTSFAAPQVTAAVALLMALGIDDPEVIRFLLFESAEDLGGFGRDIEFGHGLLDLLRAHQGLGFAS
jgi:hypothetical protein